MVLSEPTPTNRAHLQRAWAPALRRCQAGHQPSDLGIGLCDMHPLVTKPLPDPHRPAYLDLYGRAQRRTTRRGMQPNRSALRTIYLYR